jgi:hypothetical protein
MDKKRYGRREPPSGYLLFAAEMTKRHSSKKRKYQAGRILYHLDSVTVALITVLLPASANDNFQIPIDYLFRRNKCAAAIGS